MHLEGLSLSSFHQSASFPTVSFSNFPTPNTQWHNGAFWWGVGGLIYAIISDILLFQTVNSQKADTRYSII